jgi:hypothetical protein
MLLLINDVQQMLVGLLDAQARFTRAAHFIQNGLQQDTILFLLFFQRVQEIQGAIVLKHFCLWVSSDSVDVRCS